MRKRGWFIREAPLQRGQGTRLLSPGATAQAGDITGCSSRQCGTWGNIVGEEVSEVSDKERRALAHDSQEASSKVVLKPEGDALTCYQD